MTTDSAEAKAEATREASDAVDGSQLARARDGGIVTDIPKERPPLPLEAVTDRIQSWWGEVHDEVAHAVEESRFGGLKDRYAERVANSDAAVIRWAYRLYLWVIAVPTKVLFTLADMITDWPGRAVAAIVVFEIFRWLLVGSLWFPW